MITPTGLPIEEVLPELASALSGNGCAILEAPPGAGKTTIVPLALLDEEWLRGRRVIMLEPRRLAARAAASRMAALLGEEPGATVGYRTRMDSKVGPSTRIEVVTEGVLTRLLQADPSLEGVGAVIFDEFHERSLNADLGLALTLEAKSLLREDLKVLVMSATLDGKEVADLLGGVPVVKSMGRAFPVEVRYLPPARPAPVREGLTGPAFISRVSSSIVRTLREERGSVLVFLPGSGEIKRVESALLESALPEGVDIVPLYGDLSSERQDLAIRPSPPGRRKVVLATSIAETSLTIDGVRVVIDGGLSRVSRFSPATGMSRLETVRVTKASAEQRSGRAGRLEPGISIRLWADGETQGLRDRNTPEILDADLAPLALELALWGIKDPSELKWLDPPPGAAIEQAREVLLHLGAIDSDGRVTDHGREMARLPLHPRLAHMTIKGKALGLGSLACGLAALLAERDILRAGPGERDSDIRHRLDVIDRSGAAFKDFDRGLTERVRAAAGQIRKVLNVRHTPGSVDEAGLLLAFAYPDRIGKRRQGSMGRYLLSGGKGAAFAGPEPLSREEYIVVASLDGGEKEAAIYLAAPLKESELEASFSGEIMEAEEVFWDQSEKGVAAKRRRALWNLTLSEAPLSSPEKGKVLDALLAGIRLNGLGALPWDRASEGLRARINFLGSLREVTGTDFPGLTGEWLMEHMKDWLGPWLEGMTRLEHLKKIDLKEALLALLGWEERKVLDRLAPTHLTVPSGSRVAIDYTGARPVLAVRIQEMFGLATTPSVAGGRVPLLIHLLSPAGRPMQVTDDLAGFWANSYQLVKKEMKGRYPKHYWPDDPASAEATRGVKRREKE